MVANVVHTATRQRVIDAAIELACGDIYDASAFEGLLRAVQAHLGATRGRGPVATVPWGPKRGKPVSELSIAELLALESTISRLIDAPEKRNFRGANMQLRIALRAELERRPGTHRVGREWEEGAEAQH